MKIFEVNSKQREKQFLKVALRIYKDMPAWIQPLNPDILGVFDPKKNKTFRHGEAVRWILVDDQGTAIGRIAAFTNDRTATRDNDQPTGGMGFFECINDQAAANALFDMAKLWLEERGMEAMDGPINFGDRNAWWGLLIEGHDLEPNYQCNYHPPYYQELLENYGFQIYFKQLTFARVIKRPVDPKLKKKAELLKDDPEYTFRHMKKSQLSIYAEHFRQVYNAAWARHPGVAEMTKTQADSIMKKMKPIMDENIIWFGYHKDQPIAFYVNLPEINQIFKYLHGRFDWLGKLMFVFYKWTRPNTKMLGLVFGVAPEYQGKGVDGALIEHFREWVCGKYDRYVNLELNWIGDFNPKMIRVAEQVGGDVSKVHATYRYLFDRNKEFKRMPIKN